MDMGNNGATNSGGMLQGLSPKASLLLGFLAAFSLLSLAANIILVNLLLGDGSSYGTLPVAVAPAPNPTQPTAPSDDTPPPVQTFTVTKQDHVKGPANAKVTLIEYSDFQCPFCGRFLPTVQQIIKEYGNKVRFVYRHFPLNSIHPMAQKAAEASECASEQGKFWEFHDLAFANQASLSLENLKVWATQLGLNAGKFNTCLDSGKYATRVQADLTEGEQKGVSGTPATFVNGQLVSGALPFEAMKQIIDQELAK